MSEIFGPTIQGEGHMIGSKTHFVRIGGCDYHCSWCDSLYAVEPHLVAQLEQMTAIEIVQKVNELPPAGWVTLSGGNPALFDLSKLVRLLHQCGYKIAVETQGTLWKQWLQACDVVTVSPKPPSSGNTTPLAVVEEFVGKMVECNLKIVVFDLEDYTYAREIFRQFPRVERWLQVGNPDVEPTEHLGYHQALLIQRLEWLADMLVNDSAWHMRDVRVTPQLHSIIWGNSRGV